MINRVTVPLEQPEYSGLLKLAVADLRTPQDQLRVILRQELERKGLWPQAELSEPAEVLKHVLAIEKSAGGARQ